MEYVGKISLIFARTFSKARELTNSFYFKKNLFSAFSAVMLGNGDYAIGFKNVSGKSLM